MWITWNSAFYFCSHAKADTFADFQDCRRSAFLRYRSWIRDVLTSSGWCRERHLLPWHLLERQGKKIREKLPQEQVTCAHLLRGIWVAMETTSPNSFPLPSPKTTKAQARHFWFWSENINERLWSGELSERITSLFLLLHPKGSTEKIKQFISSEGPRAKDEMQLWLPF